MAKTYEQLQKEIQKLQAEADRIRRKEVDDVVGRIREAIDFYGLTAADLGLGPAAVKSAKVTKAAKAPGRKRRSPGKAAAPKKEAAAPMYRDETGRTWGGRGKRPQWLRDALAAGRTLAEFRIAEPG